MTNRQPAGSPLGKGGEFAESTEGKLNIPTAQAVATLAKKVDALETKATDGGNDKAWDAYEVARVRLDEAFRALLPAKIANLSVGDEVDFVFVDPDYEGNRAELKASNAVISEKMLADLKAGTLTIGDGFMLLDILPAEPIDEEDEAMTITVEESDGTVITTSYQNPDRAAEDFLKLMDQI